MVGITKLITTIPNTTTCCGSLRHSWIYSNQQQWSIAGPLATTPLPVFWISEPPCILPRSNRKRSLSTWQKTAVPKFRGSFNAWKWRWCSNHVRCAKLFSEHPHLFGHRVTLNMLPPASTIHTYIYIIITYIIITTFSSARSWFLRWWGLLVRDASTSSSQPSRHSRTGKCRRVQYDQPTTNNGDTRLVYGNHGNHWQMGISWEQKGKYWDNRGIQWGISGIYLYNKI